jgi:hypothetical protein
MPSAQLDLTDFQGLVTAPGLLERSPASFIETRNWEFPAPGIIRKRRGFRRLVSGTVGANSWSLFNSVVMGVNILVHAGASNGTQLRYGDGAAPLSVINTIDASNLDRPTTQRMKMAVARRNHFLTAQGGVARLESDIGSSTVRYAGMPRGRGASGPLGVVAGTNWLADGYSRAYRVTWHRLDADDIELGGPPTARFVCTNAAFSSGYAAAARSAAVQFEVPYENGTLSTPLTTSYFWRLWGNRSFNQIGGQSGDDECYLIAERYLTAGEITVGLVTYTDETPDEFLTGGPTLHTNLSTFAPDEAGIRQGVVNEDGPPPQADGVAYWDDVMWYSATTLRPRISVALIANLADGDTIDIGSNGVTTTITARNAPGAATEFQIAAAPPTSALDIRETTRAMVACINLNCAADGVAAYHVSTATTQPGLVFLESARVDLGNINFNPSAPTKFLALSGYNLGRDQPPFTQSNALWFSKTQRADAVPPINQLVVGPSDATILRIFPYRDRLLVFTDYGIFVVTGRTYADFAVFPFDLGFRLLGPEMVALCDERVYAWCFEGIVEIDDGGVKVISAPIEPTIENALVATGTGPSASTDVKLGWNCVAELGFAVAYRQAHQVRFHYPQADDPTDLQASHFWLSFDTRTRCWAQGEFSRTQFGGYYDARSCGVVRYLDDILMVATWDAGSDWFLFEERRNYDGADFKDTDRAGGDGAVSSTLTPQFAVPDDKGAQHWQETVVNWDGSEVPWRPLPTSADWAYETETQVAVAGTVAVSALATRVEPPLNVRRGQRLHVGISHALPEYAGIVGISQSYRSGSRFARRVTP